MDAPWHPWCCNPCGCIDCDSTSQFQVEISGIVSSDCPNCERLNDTFTIPYLHILGACGWSGWLLTDLCQYQGRNYGAYGTLGLSPVLPNPYAEFRITGLILPSTPCPGYPPFPCIPYSTGIFFRTTIGIRIPCKLLSGLVIPFSENVTDDPGGLLACDGSAASVTITYLP